VKKVIKKKLCGEDIRIDKVLKEKCDEVLQIAASYGARNVRIFGSLARGEAGPDSDIDILVNLDSGRSLLDIIALKQDLEDLLGCEVDVVTEEAISPYIREQVLKETVSL
jgi:predicted nucleotidyltransferase